MEQADLTDQGGAVLAVGEASAAAGIPQELLAEARAALADPAALIGSASAAAARPGAAMARAGAVNVLPRPGRRPARLLLIGVGSGDEAGWRAAGAAAARAAGQEPSLTIALPPDIAPEAVRGLAEGLWLAAYRYRLNADPPGTAPSLRQVTLAVPDPPPPGRDRTDRNRTDRDPAGRDPAGRDPAQHDPADRGPARSDPARPGPDRYAAVLAEARVTAEATYLARDLTNTPSSRKNPAWFAQQVRRAAARYPGLTLTVRDPRALAAEGFGGILAVGGGSASPPRLVELAWRPRGAGTHVVLIGKGITFDSGGISIKTREGMRLMRKDMGGAAAVIAATLGAAARRLPVRITTLAPLAENMVGGASYRPADVVRHYGGLTSEIHNTDAEGRLVLADALAYAASRLRPDLLVDLATLTGANAVALGKRTAALYTEDDELAEALTRAAAQAGEQIWRMPLAADYIEYLGSDVADLNHAPDLGAGSVVAALYLREFTGAARQRWVHLDMSAPAWSERADAELPKGATGWGVRTLLRWLSTLT